MFSNYNIKQWYENNKFKCLYSVEDWLQTKKNNDKVGDLWRVDDKLYDLNPFVALHPGGVDWIQSTKGTDITELYHSIHLSSKPDELLKNYYVKDAGFPRQSPIHL